MSLFIPSSPWSQCLLSLLFLVRFITMFYNCCTVAGATQAVFSFCKLQKEMIVACCRIPSCIKNKGYSIWDPRGGPETKNKNVWGDVRGKKINGGVCKKIEMCGKCVRPVRPPPLRGNSPKLRCHYYWSWKLCNCLASSGRWVVLHLKLLVLSIE